MIDIKHVKKSYGRRCVLEDVSFQAQVGDCVVIVGRNGCGKSTLLQILAGVITPDDGTIRYFGNDPLKDHKRFRLDCGYVPQENPLMEDLSVLDNLRLWGFRKRNPDPVILQQFGLEELLTRNVEQLSGGMKRRVSIACAAIAHPPIMLLDEPTTALDLFYRREIQQWMKLYRQRGGMIVMTTHEESEILDASHCMVMHEGKLYELTDADRRMERILNITKEEFTNAKQV